MAHRLSAKESVENARRRVRKQVKHLEKNKDAEEEGVEGHDDAGRRRVVQIDASIHEHFRATRAVVHEETTRARFTVSEQTASTLVYTVENERESSRYAKNLEPLLITR